MKACILVGVESDSARAAQRLALLPGVVDAFPVLGRKEVVVRADVRSMHQLADLLDRTSGTTGVVVSESLLEIPQVVRD